MNGHLLRRRYPCCGGPARLGDDDRYARRCPRCQTRWIAYVEPASDYLQSRMRQRVRMVRWVRADEDPGT